MNAFKLSAEHRRSSASQTASRAVRNGKAAEEAWSLCHDRMWSMRIAYIHKVEVPRIIVDGVHKFVRKVGSDYRGVMLDGSQREIVLESKSTVGTSLSLTDARHGLKPHQRVALNVAWAQGGVSAILLTFRTPLRIRFFVLPWISSHEGTRVLKVYDTALTPFEVTAGEPYLSRWMVGAR